MTIVQQGEHWRALNALNEKINNRDRDICEIVTNRDAAIEEIATVVAELRNRVEADAVSELRDEFRDFKEITVLVEDLQPIRETINEFWAARNDLVEEDKNIAGSIIAINDEIAMIKGTVSSLCTDLQRINEVSQEISDIRTDLQRINEVSQEISDIHTDLTARIQEKHSDIIEVVRNIDRLDDVVVALNDTVEKLNSESTSNTYQIGTINGDIEKFSNEITDVRNEVKFSRSEYLSRTSELQAQITQAIQSTVCKLPKNLIVDARGQLIGIDGNGDTVVIGQVAISVTDAKIENNRIQLILTDGRKIDAGQVSDLEVKPKPKKSKATRNKQKFLKWFEKQDKNGLDTKYIAKEYGVTVQTVYRWMRDVNTKIPAKS